MASAPAPAGARRARVRDGTGAGRGASGQCSARFVGRRCTNSCSVPRAIPPQPFVNSALGEPLRRCEEKTPIKPMGPRTPRRAQKPAPNS
eukprot:11213930-Lingulodinium_polyedra.AAC.1